MPHGGELVGPASVAACLDDLHADRIGHGVRAAEDPALVKRLAAEAVTCEVCPSSNVALGVAPAPAQVPLPPLFEAGVPVALGADDPLLFGPRLTAQYEIARHAHGFTDAELADLARMSVASSAAPEPVRARLLAGIDAWLAGYRTGLGPFWQNGPWCWPAPPLASRGGPRPTTSLWQPCRLVRVVVATTSFAGADPAAAGDIASREQRRHRLALHAHGVDPAITGEPPEERAAAGPE